MISRPKFCVKKRKKRVPTSGADTWGGAQRIVKARQWGRKKKKRRSKQFNMGGQPGTNLRKQEEKKHHLSKKGVMAD